MEEGKEKKIKSKNKETTEEKQTSKSEKVQTAWKFHLAFQLGREIMHTLVGTMTPGRGLKGQQPRPASLDPDESCWATQPAEDFGQLCKERDSTGVTSAVRQNPSASSHLPGL